VRQPTESSLKDWRWGQTIAERLCAALLHVEQFTDVDPQCPLGGPDGLKDVLCTKDGKTYVAAAYFATTEKRFSEIKTKFENDLSGIHRNSADGFLFFLNQRLSPTERRKLTETASPALCTLYHLERILSVLDSPKGYGVRLEYLKLPMSVEEQQSFWSNLNYDITRRLISSEETLADISSKLDVVLHRTKTLDKGVLQPSSLLHSHETLTDIEQPTSQLSIGMLSWIHSLLLADIGLPENSIGKIRSVRVFIGEKDVPEYVPAEPGDIPRLLRELVAWWRHKHSQLSTSDDEGKINGLTAFHHRFLVIHPFLDGNGRVARALLDQASREFFGQAISLQVVSDPVSYFAALRLADAGDLTGLNQLIRNSLL
jgi:fido (protein-threonine AMPylation protein)